MRNNLLRKTLVIGITVLFVGLIIVPSINSQINLKQKNISTGLASFNPFKEGWQYRKKITINHNKVDENLMNFPVLVSTIDSDLRDKAQNDGDDILFMDDKGKANLLYHEIEYFDGSSGELVTWVNIPILFNSVDTVFYMYYGNLTCASLEFPEMVWDSYYSAVYHMCDSTGANLVDSTANSHTLTATGSCESVTGKIGKAMYYDGSNDYHSLDHADFYMGAGDYTLEIWVAPDTDAHTDHRVAISKGGYNARYVLWGNRNNTENGFAQSDVDDDSTYYWIQGSIPMSDGVFRYLVTARENDALGNGHDELRLRINDAEEDSIDLGDYGNLNQVFKEFMVGGYSLNPPLYRFKGKIDEVRVSKGKARSDSWLATSYNTMNDPSSFLTIGPEEPKNRVYINTPFLNFLQQRFLNLFPILRLLLQR